MKAKIILYFIVGLILINVALACNFEFGTSIENLTCDKTFNLLAIYNDLDCESESTCWEGYNNIELHLDENLKTIDDVYVEIQNNTNHYYWVIGCKKPGIYNAKITIDSCEKELSLDLRESVESEKDSENQNSEDNPISNSNNQNEVFDEDSEPREIDMNPGQEPIIRQGTPDSPDYKDESQGLDSDNETKDLSIEQQDETESSGMFSANTILILIAVILALFIIILTIRIIIKIRN